MLALNVRAHAAVFPPVAPGTVMPSLAAGSLLPADWVEQLSRSFVDHAMVDAWRIPTCPSVSALLPVL